jgi:hypothetical protein
VRSQQREEFDRKVKERDSQACALEQARLMEIKKQEEEEIRKIRQQMVFKASKIRKYRFVVRDEEACKKRSLTVPQPPKLYTKERASLKDEMS